METNPYPNEAFAKVDGRRRVSGFSALRSLLVPDSSRTPYRGTGNKPKLRQSRRSTVNTKRRHFRHWKAKRRGAARVESVVFGVFAVFAVIVLGVGLCWIVETVSTKPINEAIYRSVRLEEIEKDRTQILESADRIRIDATNARIWCRSGAYEIEGLHDPNPMLVDNPWDHRVQIIGGRYVATADSPQEGNGVWAHCTNLNAAWLAPESVVNFDSWVRLRNVKGWSENNTLGHAGWKVHVQNCEQAPIVFDDGGPYTDGVAGWRSFARTIVDNVHIAGRTGLMDLLGSAKVYDSWFFVGGNVAPTCQRMAWLAEDAQLYNCVLNFGFEGTARTFNDYNSAHIFSSNRFTGKLPEAWRNNVTNCRWRVRYEDKSRDAAETNG